MSFGKLIKKLRRERNMTQEQLAEILSISPQAVSRWETEMAMPDISLIAPLCHLFDVTSDELLGIDLTKKQEAINAICEEASKYFNRGYLEEARKILEDGLAQYPENLDIMYDLMYVAWGQCNSSNNKKYIDDAITWGEKILEKSTNDAQRHGAIQILCYSYHDAGRLEEAVKMAESMPYISISQECLLSSVLSGSREYDAKQSEVYNLLQFLSGRLCCMQTQLDSGEWAYTAEECAILRDKQIALLHLFFENGDFGFYHTHLCDTHREQATYYAKQGEEENALKHLSLAAEHAIKFITSYNEEKTSLVFRGRDSGSWCTNSSENDAARLLRKMQADVFDCIRDQEEFIKIKEKLSEYAGNWNIQQ
ncbi:MAG: helix-turn-helix transcriptional regulator [Clostridia bacterium]|nr:helix-turn-helix transcriptional regulator [Clostridia bacterium]